MNDIELQALAQELSDVGPKLQTGDIEAVVYETTQTWSSVSDDLFYICLSIYIQIKRS